MQDQINLSDRMLDDDDDEEEAEQVERRASLLSSRDRGMSLVYARCYDEIMLQFADV